MGFMTNRNNLTGKLPVLLVAFAVLAGFQPRTTKAQDIDQLRKTAEQGDSCAQSILGLMYDKGEGVPEDDRKAGKWFRLAAEQGHAEAQFNLGYMYANGEGVGRDYVKAYIWANLAAAQGGDRVVKPEELVGGGESIKLKDWLRKKMTAEQVAEAQKLSVELFNRIESSELDLLRRDCSSMQSNRLPARPAPSPEPAGKADHEAERMLKESGVTTTLPEPIDTHALSRDVIPPTTLPTLLYRVEPVYSKKARKAKLQGSVMISAIVRKDGTLEVLKVVRGLGLGLDENAIKALKRWRFRPGTKDGRPVDVPLNIEVKFSRR